MTELLVAVAIIIVLVALSVPVLNGALHKARAAKCVGNLREIGAAALAYAGENNNCLPPICELPYGKAWSAAAANRWWPSFLAGSTSPSSAMVYSTWRCPEVKDEDFQVEQPSGLTYSSYTPLRPLVSFIETENPTGGMRLGAIKNPVRVWMFGDGGRPVAGGGDKKSAPRYETVGAMQRYGKNWASAARPVCRHGGKKRANYVACDGHVESLTQAQIDDLDNGAFGVFNGSVVDY